MSKKFPKIFTLIFLSLVILQTGAFVFSTLFYTPTNAQAVWKNPTDNFFLTKFSTPTACVDDATKTCVPWIGDYIANIYKYGIGIVGILAAVVMMFGGVVWLTAGGNQSRIGEAKSWIGASLTGLVLALTSYMILYQINPDLVNSNPLRIKSVERIEIADSGCGWKTLISEGEWKGEVQGDAITKKCEEFGLVKQDDSRCGGEKPPTFDTCCCAAAGGIGMCKPAAPYPDYCIECKDCENATIQCKETPCMVNKSLNAKLNTLYGKLASSGNMQINEPWPSTVKHDSSCHKDGTCVDVALKFTGATSEETCKYADDIVNTAKSLGLKVLNEYAACGGKTYETTTGNNIHIGL